MADYYDQAAAVIPCTKEQAQEAIEALDWLQDAPNDFVAKALKKEPHESMSPGEMIVRACFEGDFLEDDEMTGIHAMPHQDGLCIYHDTFFNADQSIAFTQAVLRAWDIDALVVLTVGLTCSKYIPGAFSGYAVVVSKDYARRKLLTPWLEAEERAHHTKEAHYPCSLTQVNGEKEYPCHFLLRVKAPNDPQDALNEVVAGMAGTQGLDDEDEAGFYWCEDGTAIKDVCLGEAIEPLLFEQMSKYLPVY